MRQHGRSAPIWELSHIISHTKCKVVRRCKTQLERGSSDVVGDGGAEEGVVLLYRVV